MSVYTFAYIVIRKFMFIFLPAWEVGVSHCCYKYSKNKISLHSSSHNCTFRLHNWGPIVSHVSHHNSAISASFIAAFFNFSHFSIRHIYMEEKTLCKCWEMLLEHLFQIKTGKKWKCSHCILFVFLIFLFSIFMCDRKHFTTVLNAATFVLDQLEKKNENL